MGKRIVWSEVGGLAEEIIDGKHDENLEYIQIACQSRVKRMFRKGQRIKLKGTESVVLEGAEGRIEKINTKSISVILDSHGPYNVPPRMLEVV